MNHAGEIDVLTRLVRPHIAIVTTVAPVHLGFFRSVEEIADAKAEIFRGLEPGGAAIINRDNPLLRAAEGSARSNTARRSSASAKRKMPRCGCSASSFEPDGSDVNADILGETISYRARRAGPSSGAELACRARRGEARRRRSRQRGRARSTGFTPSRAAARAR